MGFLFAFCPWEHHASLSFYFILFIYLFIYLFLAVLGLRFCARAFSSCGKWGPLFIAVRGPLTIAASPVVEHRLQTRRLSSCGSRAQLLHGMWDPPRPGLEPVPPALAGRFSTTAPPGKPPNLSSLRNLVVAVVPGVAVETKEQFFQHSQNLSHTPPATTPAATKKHRLIGGLGCQSHRALLQLRDASPSRTAPLLRGLSFSALCRPSF